MTPPMIFYMSDDGVVMIMTDEGGRRARPDELTPAIIEGCRLVKESDVPKEAVDELIKAATNIMRKRMQ